MTSTNPPDPNVNTFNNEYWSVGETTLTQEQADKRYLRFPIAQGTENLAAINVNGNANFNNPIELTGSLANRIIDMNNGEIHQVSLVHSQVNNDITIEGRGTGSVVLETAATPRFTLDVGGNISLQGGLQYTLVTNAITNANWEGNINITDTSTNANFYPVFTSDDGNQILRINKAPVQLIYNPATDTLTCSNFNGSISNATNASNVLVTTDNTAGTYYIPFSKTSGTGNKALFQDDTTGPLTYNPSTATLTATNFAGTITVTNDGSSTSFCPVVLSPSGTTGQKALVMDDISTFSYLVYRPNDGLLCVPRIDNGIIPIFDDFLNLNNGPFGFTYASGGGSAYTINNAALGNQISSFGNARIGLLQIDSGGGASANQSYVNGSSGITTANMGTISFGVVPLGIQTLNSITTANNANETYTHYAVGLSSGANTTNTTQNGFFWRNTNTTGNTNSWEFVINNAVKATSTGTNLTGPLTGKWLRFDITAVSASTLSVRLTNLTDGVAFTPSNIAVSAGEQAQFSNIYMAVGSQLDGVFAADKYMGVDYVYMNNINTQLLQGIPQRSNTGASAR